MTTTRRACGAQTRNAVFSPSGIAPRPAARPTETVTGCPPFMRSDPVREPVPWWPARRRARRDLLPICPGEKTHPASPAPRGLAPRLLILVRGPLARIAMTLHDRTTDRRTMMSKPSGGAAWQRAIVTLTGTVIGVVVIGTLYWAQAVFIPVALAGFLTFLLSPLVSRLRQLGLPRTPSVIVAVVFSAA